MESKTYTFLITSNRHGKTHAITIRSAWIKTIVAFGIVFAVLIAAIGVDYFGLLLDQGENKRLRAENSQLTRQFEVVEGKLSTLEDSLDRIKTLTTKIKLITNIDDDDRVMNLSVPHVPRFEQNMAQYESGMQDSDVRGPASTEFIRPDATFLQRPPLDEMHGELAATRNDNYADLSIRIDRAVKESTLEEQGVIQLQELLQERQSILNATPSIKPVNGWFTSPFGYRVDPFTGRQELHAGVDIAAPIGTPVMSPADGVVSYIGYEAGYGKLLVIDNGYGVHTRFGHNSQIYVHLGQKVKRRDIISAVGSTGRSTGPHCHYEVRVNDVPVNPMNYILNE